MARSSAALIDTTAASVIDAVFARTGTVPEAEGRSTNLPVGAEPLQGIGTPASFGFPNQVAWDDFLGLL